MQKFLIVGLGNIGAEYALTRHNIGFMVVDKLAFLQETSFQTDRLADVADFKHKGKHIFLIKPSTYMNLSGRAVNYWKNELKIPLENLLVITDDVALPFGKIRLRSKGSDGGHNGLKNIQEVLQSQDYARMRIGIGNNYPKGMQAEYVLSPFSQEEQKQLPTILEIASQAILTFCLEGISNAMNKFNGKG
ncbi:MAG: aminoacyl-tRNA hydrolase [Raineya sp.]|nr:aminoacyl-tRNA hydrolase [Raineya sp.]MDW8296890.1 aminoacyl-tRNA hydrolase [Raineya sp.]